MSETKERFEPGTAVMMVMAHHKEIPCKAIVYIRNYVDEHQGYSVMYEHKHYFIPQEYLMLPRRREE